METKGTPALEQEQFAAPQTSSESISETTQEVATPQETCETPQAQPVPESAPESAPACAGEGEAETPQCEESAPQEQSIPDYNALSQEELVATLEELLKSESADKLKSAVDQIKTIFYKVLNAQIETQKAEFEKENPEGEFKAEENPLEQKIKSLMSQYRREREQLFAQSEQEKQANYAAKLRIIEQLKELTNSSETMGSTFNTFRELQTQWKEIGAVPASHVRDLWDTYNHHTENFYNYIKINKELRDLDLKKNLELKTTLCQEAEALLEAVSAVNAFHKLQKLHTAWRETGPVSAEFKEQLWERFKQASSHINKRHQEHYDQIKQEQLSNLQLKEELCERVETIAKAQYNGRAQWDTASNDIIEIQKVWKSIGFAPKKDNTTIYERFRAACDSFFNAKREFFEGQKSDFADNYQLKVDLCVQAEAHTENVSDWKEATDQIIALQKQWKTIGPTSRKHSDAVWKRFRAACDKFFDAKTKHFEESDSQFADNLTAKQAIIAELEAMNIENSTLDVLKDIQNRWGAIGFVPIKQKQSIQKQYKTLTDKLYDAIRSGQSSRRMDNFKNRAQQLRGMGEGSMSSERKNLLSKQRHLETEIATLENNIGFFGNSKNAEALIKDVQTKIQRAKQEIAEIKEKLQLIED